MNKNNFSHKIFGVVVAFTMSLILVQFPLTIEEEDGGFITFHPPASSVAIQTAESGAAEGWIFPSLSLHPDGLDQSLDSLVGPLFGPYSQAQDNFPE